MAEKLNLSKAQVKAASIQAKKAAAGDLQAQAWFDRIRARDPNLAAELDKVTKGVRPDEDRMGLSENQFRTVKAQAAAELVGDSGAVRFFERLQEQDQSGKAMSHVRPMLALRDKVRSQALSKAQGKGEVSAQSILSKGPTPPPLPAIASPPPRTSNETALPSSHLQFAAESANSLVSRVRAAAQSGNELAQRFLDGDPVAGHLVAGTFLTEVRRIASAGR
jgi:hypothetical protein